mmetsp:Transcript_52018/g.114142  ORF Transcript_52018/g.114142 Transcript_52018/m.114142 type:complete len:222 (-) Transcript_52018:904-1569(-)
MCCSPRRFSSSTTPGSPRSWSDKSTSPWQPVKARGPWSDTKASSWARSQSQTAARPASPSEGRPLSRKRNALTPGLPPRMRKRSGFSVSLWNHSWLYPFMTSGPSDGAGVGRDPLEAPPSPSAFGPAFPRCSAARARAFLLAPSTTWAVRLRCLSKVCCSWRSSSRVGGKPRSWRTRHAPWSRGFSAAFSSFPMRCMNSGSDSPTLGKCSSTVSLTVPLTL